MSSIVYGGLDVHKGSISACLLRPDTGEVLHEELVNDRAKVLKAVKRWQRKLGDLRLCYEASGAGFVVKRWMDEIGVGCEVIAPSLIPKAPGDRVKTDRRDARKLAGLYQAGLLQAVRVPTMEEERDRALVRLRDDLTRDMTRCKNRILKYLGVLGYHYGEGATWTQKHRAWIAALNLDPSERFIVQTHLDKLDHLMRSWQEIDKKIDELAHSERYWARVQRLMSLKGIAVFSAMVILTEVGDVRRFGGAKHLMSYAGVVSREDSSADRRRTGSITKAGNNRLRWILTEAAWHQKRTVGSCARVRKHWQSQDGGIVAIGKKAEKRLHHKFWKIANRKDQKTAVVAVAREMAGFIWAMLMA